MTETRNCNNIDRLNIDDKQIVLIGTAHISQESADLVAKTIEAEQPDTVCVELCQSRYDAIRQQDRWQNTDIIKVIKEKKSFLLLSNLMLAAFQKRIAKNMDIKPGQEMIQAIESAETAGAAVHLADRDIRITLSRTWRSMGWWAKIKLLFQMLLSFSEADDITQEQIEQMKRQDVLASLLDEVGQSAPVLKSILIDERDQYLAQKIKTAPGQKIVAVVGAGHVPGIKVYLDKQVNLAKLEQLPPKGRIGGILKWLLPAMIVALLGLGFFYGGRHAGGHMLGWWIAANGVMAGLGAIIALAHPLTIVSSVVAAPLTSLNPMIAAGWVSGLVEAFTRKPCVRDFNRLADDILSIKGFWHNKVTRILLVVVFTNLGSAVGTFVAIPLMLRVL